MNAKFKRVTMKSGDESDNIVVELLGMRSLMPPTMVVKIKDIAITARNTLGNRANIPKDAQFHF